MHLLPESRKSESLDLRVITAAAADGWNGAVLRMEKLDDDLEPMLLEVEA
jgi:hypothetical protein